MTDSLKSHKCGSGRVSPSAEADRCCGQSLGEKGQLLPLRWLSSVLLQDSDNSVGELSDGQRPRLTKAAESIIMGRSVGSNLPMGQVSDQQPHHMPSPGQCRSVAGESLNNTCSEVFLDICSSFCVIRGWGSAKSTYMPQVLFCAKCFPFVVHASVHQHDLKNYLCYNAAYIINH